MERKLRYKLHKVKKQWVTIAVASAGLASVIGAGAASQTVSADDIGNGASASAEQNTSASQNKEVVDSDAAQATDAKATSEQAAVSSVDTNSETDQVQNVDGVSANNQPEAPAAPQAAASNNTNTATSEEANTNTAVSEAAPAAENRTAEKGADLSDQEEAAALSLDNIKKVDGKYYYVMADGSYKKNFAITVKGQLLYFDAETGALSSTSTYSFSQGLTPLVSDFSINNKAFDSSAKSFELVDGYLTAESWYRPTKILENGKTWVDSKETDLRPVLTSWWPDKDTQVAYLNYMSKALGGKEEFTTKTSQTALNTAAEMIQMKIEQRISKEQGTAWLRDAMAAFVATQSRWNSDSEQFDKNDHLQGGALLYTNNKLTEWADSKYRLLNRTPTRQDGKTHYSKADEYGGYEFLLANDVDNSNPVVQAEMLNQIHYLMNWGSIVMGDKDANFDGIRVDAVDNVDADTLQLYTNYFNAVYGVDKSEAQALAHISILEAWSYNDNYYNQDTNGAALAMDNGLRLSLLYTLTRPLSERTPGLSTLIKSEYGLTDRTKDDKYGDTQPSYVFVRAHDSEVQTVIAQIIKEKIDPTTDGFTFTLDQLKQAFDIYNKDMNSVEKHYTHYNIPAAYAVMLSNMESVTRVYYGDLFTDDGQYMETKSPYYDAINTLLRARIRYAAGGQTMEHKAYTPSAAMKAKNPDSGSVLGNSEVLVSVRFGQDVMSADDMTGGQLAKTSGMFSLIANNPELELDANEEIKVNVGKIHAGQAYRPLLLTTDKGLQKYLNDSDTNLTKVADKDGFITFKGSEIKGYKQVEVNGYLSVWVPVGAKSDQDIRVAASTKANAKGDKSYTASQALDSQLIYEGFSNFQDFVQKDAQYTNKKIAENTDLFKAWGVTSFEMAPQYVSATDGTFLDSIIQNGYAFSDRYDLAMSKNNKYGSKEDLANALKALHAAGIQAIADWVPDQIYQLPGKEVVTASRVDNYGRVKIDQPMVNKLYLANTKSSGKDFQAKYGGEFLAELQKQYPEMFTAKMISTGKPIDSSVKLKEWSAQYFNGTNVLGRGTDYVLSDEGTGKYFTVNEKGEFLPAVLTGDKEAKTGFYNDGKGMTYFTTAGSQAKSDFVTVAGNTYYFDYTGHMVTGPNVINTKFYYFLPNGVMLKDAVMEDDRGRSVYYGKTGVMYKGSRNNEWFAMTDSKGQLRFRHFDNYGFMSVGLVTIHGNVQYYDEEGFQVKGDFVTDKAGQTRYFDKNTGNLVKGQFFNQNGHWYYSDDQGLIAKGAQTIKGQKLYFDAKTGAQVKGDFVTDKDGNTFFYSGDTGDLAVSTFFSTGNNAWFYADENGHVAKGEKTINGQKLYFDTKTGQQAKGRFVRDAKGLRFYDADTGALVTNSFLETKAGSNQWYYMGADGYAVRGHQTIQSRHMYFDAETGQQAKGIVVTDANGRKYFYDANTGDRVVNQFVLVNGSWYFFGYDGAAVTGFRDIRGQHLYFNPDGTQAKGTTVKIDNRIYTFDADSGELTSVRYI
ncbi:glucosyltransferase-I [Streptococcus criceti]|uniref:dextransucrase n=1 Tax=Streptococcus criceti HS-6 TaxID=873449 RepID=G5JML0_STRCG|nr:glycoside hydrolase family 70 protein [Streptococcus criceti]EHI74032.1 Glucosyltransferase-S family protein [Streptococcus criceti HS-6]SUN38710.1 glucosyltransferase-I [Streptococcus criceti]